jgi:hypothetical protein
MTDCGISEYLNNIFSTLSYQAENFAVDNVIMIFKGRVVFQQYTPKKQKKDLQAL